MGARVNRWLHSSELTLEAGHALRISARLLRDGGIEFALQQRIGDEWGDRHRPRPRLFPATVAAGRWLYSGGVHLDGQPLDSIVPSDRFSAVATGWDHGCGLRGDQAIECWGSNFRGQAQPPAGAFLAATAGEEYSCGLRTDDTIQCWGLNTSGTTDAPAGAFSTASAGRDHVCALPQRPDHRVLGRQ